MFHTEYYIDNYLCEKHMKKCKSYRRNSQYIEKLFIVLHLLIRQFMSKFLNKFLNLLKSFFTGHIKHLEIFQTNL